MHLVLDEVKRFGNGGIGTLGYGEQRIIKPEFLECVSPDGTLRAFTPDSAVSLDTCDLFGAYMMHRREFIRSMNWVSDSGLESYTDIDEVDRHPSSIYVLASLDEPIRDTANHRDDLVFAAGMRLTPYGCIEDSLSYRMLEDAPEMRDEMSRSPLINKINKSKGTIWDITRLVPMQAEPAHRRVEIAEIIDAVNRIIGGAATATGIEQNDTWIFLVHQQFRDFLDNQGFKYAILADGIASSKGDKATFIALNPLESYQHLTNERSRRQVVKGIEGLRITNFDGLSA